MDRVELAASESDLLALGAELLAARKSAPANSEEALEKLAASLATKGTPASLSFLDELAATEPLVLVERDGCRHPVLAPLYSFDIEATRSAWTIRRRDSAPGFAARLSADDPSLVNELSSLDLQSPQLASLVDVLGVAQTSEADALLAQLKKNASTSWTDAQSVAAAASLLRLQRAPFADELLRFSGPGALYLLEHSAGLPDDERGRLFEIARQHPAVASLAILMDANAATTLPADVYLRNDGDSAALMLSRDRSPERTALLSEILLRGALEMPVRRRAALALMLQDTPDAVAALRDAVGNQTLPLDLREEIERAIP